MDFVDPSSFDADEDLVSRAIAIAGERYGCDGKGAGLMIMDWARAAGVPAVEVSQWLMVDALANRKDPGSPF